MSKFANHWWQRCCLRVDHVATLAQQSLWVRGPAAYGKQPPKISTLEPMVLFSATPIDPAMMDVSGGVDAATMMEIPLDSEAESQQSTTASSVQNPEQQSTSVTSEIIVIDALTPDLDALLEDLRLHREGSEVIVLDADRDGVTQISEILESRTDVRSLQIISHSEDASVRLGNLWLEAGNLDAYAGEIASWRNSLTADADILFYGCDLAANADGRTLVDSIAALTGADVAASDNDSGHARYGADWNLEYATGIIEAEIVVSQTFQDSWEHKLATITVTTWVDESNNNGETSLREAITQANAGAGGDTIVFAASLDTSTVFRLTRQNTEDNANSYGDLDILKDVTIVGHGINTTIIDGIELSRIFDVHGGTLTMSDVTLQGGRLDTSSGGAIQVNSSTGLILDRALLTNNSGVDGGAISNFGTIELTDVAIIDNGGIAGLSTNTGGGILNRGIAKLNRVTLSGNVATVGGAIFAESGSNLTSLVNVTVSGNTGTNAGGGLYIKATAEIVHSTITLNDSNVGGGVFVEAGTTTVSNSIITGNVGTSESPDVKGTFTSNGGNLIGDLGASSGFGGEDLVGQNADLAALANNGGYVQTHQLQGSSAAINAAEPEYAAGGDARSFVSFDVQFDSGAYQTQSGVIDRIFWVDNDLKTIQSSRLDGSDLQTLVSGLTTPEELFVDSQNQHIYFSDAGSSVIRRVNFDGSQLTDILTDLDEPQGIEIDLDGGKIYWIEDGDLDNTVRRADLDGSNAETLATITAGLYLTKPDDIELDLVNGHVYWSDELTRKIERMDFDGSNRTLLITAAKGVRGIALDAVNGKLYYAMGAYTNGEIKRIDLDGNNATELINSGLNGPNGLDIDQANGKLYWADSGSSSIFAANLDGSEITAVNIAGLSRPHGLALGSSQDNRTPLSLGFRPNQIAENTDTTSGFHVGTLSAIDADANETFTYSVVGGADAASFSVGGSNSDELILTAGVLDHEAQSAYTVIVNVVDSQGNVIAQTLTLRVHDLSEINGVWFTTEMDVSSSTVNGVSAWGEDQVVQISDPNLTLEPNGGTTSGTGSLPGFRLETFTAETSVAIAGMHSVWSGVSVGSGPNGFDLVEGDLVFTIDTDDVNFSSTSEPDKMFGKDDVIVFRATTPGDYSSGDFFHLLDNPLGADIRGISMVESEGGVTVGDTTLAQGTFLFSRSGGSVHDSVFAYHADSVGLSNTSGLTTLLIEGDDSVEDSNGGNLGFSAKIVGLHLVESDTTIGGVAVTAGDLLISVDANGNSSSTIGGVTGTNQDVFRLTMTSTRIGGNASVANVELLFDGTDVGLASSANQKLHSLTFVEIETANNPIGAITDIDADPSTIAENAIIGATVGVQVSAADVDGDAVTYSLVNDPDSKFAIDSSTGIVTLAGNLNYDNATQHSFTARATSADTTFVEQIFVVQITDVNTSPTVALSQSSLTLPESTSTSSRIKMADIVVTDDASGTNQLSLSGDDAAQFEIIGDELFLKAGATLDFESDAALDVTINVDDSAVGGGIDSSTDFTMTLLDVNEAPSFTLGAPVTSVSEDEDMTGGLKVADLVVSDDALGTETFFLSGDDAGLFEVVGTELRLRAGITLDFFINPHLDVTIDLDDASLGAGSEDTQTLQVEVTKGNTPPMLDDWQNTSLAGQTVQVSASVFEGLSDDVDGQALTAHLSSGPLVGTLDLQSDGGFTFTPPTGFIGSITFEWTSFDSHHHSAPATVTLDFLPVPALATAPAPPEAKSSSEILDAEAPVSSSDSESGEKSEDSSSDTEADSEASSEGESGDAPVGIPNASTTNPDGSGQQGAQSSDAEESATELERMNVSVNEARLANEVAERERQIERTQLGLNQPSERMQRLDLDFDFGSDRVSMTSMDYALMTQPGEMWDQLDNYQQKVNLQINGDLIVVGTAGAAASSVTVGVVAWALRSGLLLSGLLAHMPAWSAVDPLLIMQGFSGTGDGETLEELMDRHDKAMTDE